ncbi:MAG: hypothetical protein ACK4V6_01850 [Microthrixaceae bacterium]
MRRSLSSRRSRALFLVVLAAVGLIASACGVTADTTAATILGREISVDDVNEIADDDALMTLLFGAAADDGNESTQSGEVARGVLLFELERAVWEAEVERWGLEVPDQLRGEAETLIDEQLAMLDQSQPRPDGRPRELSSGARELLVEFVASRGAVAQRLAALDTQDESDLRLLYNGSTPAWDQYCVTIATMGPEQADAADAALADGATIDDLAERVEGIQIAVDAEQACLARTDLPPRLLDTVREATPRRTSSTIVLDDGAGGLQVVVVRVQERRTVSFEEAVATGQLATLAQRIAESGTAAWAQYLVADAEINPRYGQGVGTNLAGQVIIEPPPAPELPRRELFAGLAPAADQQLVVPDADGS